MANKAAIWFKKANRTGEDEYSSVIYCNPNRLKTYKGQVRINGKRTDGASACIVFNNNIFFDIDVLQENTSRYFILERDGMLIVRRKKIKGDALLQCGKKQCVALEAVLPYISIDRKAFKRNGNISIDTSLPQKMEYSNAVYCLEDSPLIPADKIQGLSCRILDDGRASWQVENVLYVEDDSGSVRKYNKA